MCWKAIEEASSEFTDTQTVFEELIYFTKIKIDLGSLISFSDKSGHKPFTDRL